MEQFSTNTCSETSPVCSTCWTGPGERVSLTLAARGGTHGVFAGGEITVAVLHSVGVEAGTQVEG